MKKICLLIILALASVNVAQADNWRSDSKKDIVVPKPPKPEKEKKPISWTPNWFVKLGGGVLAETYGDNIRPNYNVEFGYQRPFTSSGVYWGAEVGSNLVHNPWKDVERASIFFGPMIGIKKPLSSTAIFDGHLGGGYQHAFIEKNVANRPYWEGGFGIWIKSFLVEIQYQGSVAAAFFDHNVLLNIGLKF